MAIHGPPEGRFHRSLGLLAFVVLLLVLLLAVGAVWPWIDALRVGWRAEPRLIAPRGDLALDEQTTVELFRRSSPAVVNITTSQHQLDPWTRNVLEVPRGTGSGIIWDDRGHIVTNFHVIDGASAARVTMVDQSSYAATLIGSSPEHDLAVLKIGASKLTLRSVPIGTVNDLQVGQKVFAIGNPFGLDHTLTTGVVSALDRTIEGPGGRPIEHMVQTDAAINPGNSGGPLLDSAGRLIGINTAIFSPSGAYAGIGFAVPVDTVNRVVPRLIAHGSYLRADLGIVADDPISAAITRQLGLEGVLVLAVKPGSPASRAGLRGTLRAADGRIIPGDIVQKVGARPVRTAADLQALLDNYELGDTISLGIIRDNRHIELDVTLGTSVRRR